MELLGNSFHTTTTTEPTEGMYEDAVQAFLHSKGKNDHLALSILTEMEERGYTPNRNLVRSLSMGLCSTVGRVQNALYILKNSHFNEMNRLKRVEQQRRRDGGELEEEAAGVRATTASLNAILLAYARLGVVNKSFTTYDEFARLGCDVDGDTFEYLMESVMLDACSAIPLHRRVRGDGTNVVGRDELHDNDDGNDHDDDSNNVAKDKDSQIPSLTTRIEYATQSQDRGGKYEEWMASHLDSAEVILLIAQQQQQLRQEGGGLNIEMSPHLLHNYVKILCLAGEADRAMDVLNEILFHQHHTPLTTSEYADTDVDANDGNDDDKNTPTRHNWTDISLDTFTFLSSTFIQLGDVEKVNDVLDMCCSAGYDDGLPSYAMERIETLKRRIAREGI